MLHLRQRGGVSSRIRIPLRGLRNEEGSLLLHADSILLGVAANELFIRDVHLNSFKITEPELGISGL